MSKDDQWKGEKWIGWNKPKTAVSKFAKVISIPGVYAKILSPGTFGFNDGTTQGWTIDQLYATGDAKMTKITPYMGFQLSNSQNVALAAEACPLIVLGSKAGSFDFYLDSPDLTNNSDWKGIKGYSLDVQRCFLAVTGDPPGYFVQLQVQVWDKTKKALAIYGEWDDKTQAHIFHEIKPMQPYHFTWTASDFTDPNLELRRLRIRLIQPYPKELAGKLEYLAKGAWLIGNVTPEK